MVFLREKLHSITAVLLCHTFLCVNGSVSTSTASSSTSSSANGQSNYSMSYSTSMSMSTVSMSPTSTFTIAPSTLTSPVAKGHSTSSILSSITTVPPTSSSTLSSTASQQSEGQSTSTTPTSSNTVSPTPTSTPSSTTSSPGDGQSSTTTSSTTVPPTSTSTPSSTTSLPAINGQSTTPPSSTTVLPTSTSTPLSTTPTPGEGQSTTPPSSTTVLPTSTSAPSSTTSSPTNGQLITTSSSTTVLPSSTSTPSSTTSLPATSQSTTPSSSTTVLPTSTSTPSSTTPPSGESTTPPSSTTVPPTSTSTPSSTTPPPSEGQSTTPSSSTIVLPTSTSTPSSTSPPSSEGQSTTLPGSTTVPPTSNSTPSSTTSPPGAQVNITLNVRVSNCSETSHENVSSPEYIDLERNLKGNLTYFYTRSGVKFVLSITLQITLCNGKYVKVVVTITFKLQFTIEFNIEEDIKQGIRNNSLGSLPVDGTRVEVAFIGQSGNFTSSTTLPLISTSTPSPTTSPPCEAIVAQVNITVYIRVSNCSGASLENVSSPEYRDLERNLKGNLTEFYTRNGVNYALTIILQTTQCMGNHVKVVVTSKFKLGTGFNITEDIKTEVSNNSLVSLPVNGSRTLVEVAFIDVGAQVNITIYVRVSNCSGALHENVSSPEYRDLERNLKGNFTDFYTRDGVNYVLIIALQTTQCMVNYVKAVVTITFKLGIGFNIEEDIETEVSDNSLVSLPVNGTLVEVAFICQSTTPSILPSSITVPPTTISIPSRNTSPPGDDQPSTTNPVPPVAPTTSTSTSSSKTSQPTIECINITYNIKEGECDRVCCDGAGGPVKMIPTCKSRSDDSCCGEEKEEGGHCPGEREDLCSEICDDSASSASSVQYPSFALVGLLAVATFFK